MTVETLPQQNGVVFNGGVDTNPSSNASKKSRESERRRRRRKQKKNKPAARAADATDGDDSDTAADDDAKENDDPQQVLYLFRLLILFSLFCNLCSRTVWSWFLGFCFEWFDGIGSVILYI